MHRPRGGEGVRTPPGPLENHKTTAKTLLEGSKALMVRHRWKTQISITNTKPAFNVGPLSACQRNAIQWRFVAGPTMARFYWYLDSLSLYQLKKKKKKKRCQSRTGTPLTKLPGSANLPPLQYSACDYTSVRKVLV